MRILIADDHVVVADGLRHIIEAEADMNVVGCAHDGTEAVQMALDKRPDVALLDHAMPLMNGTEAAGIIRERRPETQVVILSMHSDPMHVHRALQAGAAGYVVKRSAGREVVDAIRAAAAGRRYLSQPLVDSVIDHFISKTSAASPVDRLSARERQVLQMLAEGRAVVEIAERLSLSPKTVETYRSRIMEKLDLHDLPSLVRFAIKHGLSAME